MQGVPINIQSFIFFPPLFFSFPFRSFFHPGPFPLVSGRALPPNPVREIVEELANEATLFPARYFREKHRLPQSRDYRRCAAPVKVKKVACLVCTLNGATVPVRFSIGSIVRTGTVRSADRLPFCTLDTTLR